MTSTSTRPAETTRRARPPLSRHDKDRRLVVCFIAGLIACGLVGLLLGYLA